jgi:hypothetical protein
MTPIASPVAPAAAAATTTCNGHLEGRHSTAGAAAGSPWGNWGDPGKIDNLQQTHTHTNQQTVNCLLAKAVVVFGAV